MIRATVNHERGTLRELVSAGADLNLQNKVVATQLLWILHCTMCHPQLSILGGSDSSDDVSKE